MDDRFDIDDREGPPEHQHPLGGQTYVGASFEHDGVHTTLRGRDLAGLAMRARLESRLFPDLEPCTAHPRIGRYEVLRRVGVGGMGEVFEAYDPQLERPVALKVLHADLTRRCRARLQREATALARLSHPGIAHVYEVAEVGDVVYLAMEFVPGSTLCEWQQDSKHPWSAVLEKYLEAAAALEAAHLAGIVHRDFKPSNVMVRPDGRVCVLDFGLARAIDYEEPVDGLALDPQAHEGASTLLSEPLTVTGSTMGTPAYMSPEQMMAEPVSAASDQFSFCAALWEALYGARPYGGQSVSELLRALVLEDIKVPPRSPWRPPWIRHALMRGLHLQPEKRYPSMSALVDALSTTPRRRLRWAGISAVGTLMLAGGAMAMLPEPAPCPPAQSRVEGLLGPEARSLRQAAFKSTGAPYYANALANAESRLSETAAQWGDAYTSVCEALGQPSPSPEVHGRLACLERGLSQIEATAETLTHADAATLQRLPWVLSALDSSVRCDDGYALRTIGRDPATRRLLSEAAAKVASGDLEDAAVAARDARTRAQRLHDEALVAEALRWEGRVAAEREAYRDAQPLLQEAVHKSIEASDSVTTFDGSLDLADVYAKRGDLDRAAEAVQRATALLPQVDLGHGPRAARLALTRGRIEALAGRFEQALEALTRAELLTSALFGERSLENAQVLKVVGDAQSDAGHIEAAKRHYARAQEIAIAVLGPDYPFVASLRYELGSLELHQGDLEKAEEHFEEAQSIYARSAPDFVGARAIVLTAQANVQLEAHRYDTAIATSDAVEELLTRHGESHHRTRIPARTIRLSALVAQERFEEALQGYFFLLGLVEAEGHDDRLGSIHANVADLMLALGRAKEARGYLDSILPQLTARLGPRTLPLAHVHHGRAAVFLTLGDLEAAEAALQEASACLGDAPPDDEDGILPRALIAEMRLRLSLRQDPSSSEVHEAARAAEQSLTAAHLPLPDFVRASLVPVSAASLD